MPGPAQLDPRNRDNEGRKEWQTRKRQQIHVQTSWDQLDCAGSDRPHLPHNPVTHYAQQHEEGLAALSGRSLWESSPKL